MTPRCALFALLCAGFTLSACSRNETPIQAGAVSYTMTSEIDRPLEPMQDAKTFLLDYRGRGLELTATRFAQVRLDSRAIESADRGKRIVCEELSVPLDLSSEQWRGVFEIWYRKTNRIAKEANVWAETVQVGKKRVWKFDCIYAQGEGLSRYSRAYLQTSGRKATVIQSSGWFLPDVKSLHKSLDTVAAHLERK